MSNLETESAFCDFLLPFGQLSKLEEFRLRKAFYAGIEYAASKVEKIIEENKEFLNRIKND